MLLRTADIAAAMSVEGLLGTDRVFAAELQALRPHPGQAASAANLRRAARRLRRRRLPPRPRLQPGPGRLLAALLAAGARRRPRHGRVRRLGRRARARLGRRQPGGAADDGRVESNGNFHGAPVAYVLDFLAIAAADVASISERRTDRFLDKARNHGLPPFLADDPGVDSGHMIAQYTQAAIVSELKRLANPASVDSIPSSAMQEDHVSMGWSAARKLRRVGRRADPGARDRGAHRRPRARPAGAAGARRRRPAPWSRCSARPASQGPGPDRHLSPEIEAAVALVAVRRRRSPPPKTVIGELRHDHDNPSLPIHAATRHRADRAVVADRGAAADADEQPRPRGRRAPRGPRRLRRHRQGGAQLGGVRRARAHADARSATTRRCSCSRASRSASCGPTSGRRGC